MSHATFSAIQIGIASPDKSREWSYGEVKKPETIISLLPSEKGTKIQWHRPAIKQRSLEALRFQPLRRTSSVCFIMVLDLHR